MLRKIVDSIRQFLADYWNSTLAAISLIGFCIASQVPGADKYTSFFIFLGANAVVWTVIEMRQLVRKAGEGADPRLTNFKSMRSARETIIAELIRELERPDEGRVTIVGGRMRSICEVLRELADRLEDRPLQKAAQRGMVITLYSMSSGFLEEWPVPGNVDDATRKKMGVDFAAQVRAARHELAALNQRASFQARHIVISLREYSSLPYVYFYLFGEQAVLWGGFHWSEDRADLDGPSSPCQLIRSGSPGFESVYRWLDSRARLLAASAAGAQS